jgi:hypothetical protein
VLGIDYSWGRPAPAAVKAAGYGFVCRYLSYSRTGKNLSRAEADALTAQGLLIVSNWEWFGDLRHDPEWAIYGPGELGRRHAAAAAAQHASCGGPSWAPIYFSVDFDVPDYAPSLPDTPGNAAAKLGGLAAYFAGVRAVLGPARVGGYGGYWAVRRLFDAQLISYGWQTKAWSGGQIDPRAHLYQEQNGIKLAGADVDVDKARSVDFGGWQVGQQAPGPAPAPAPQPAPAPAGHWITVHKGDTLFGIAAHAGMGGNAWPRIWHHPNNAGVRHRRGVPEHIQPGDRLFIPA